MSTPAPPSVGEWTVRRVLEWTIGHLKERGSDSPRLDAEILLAHAWNCPRIQLYTRYDQALPDDVRTTMRELVKRRAAREPVAYLIGRREFFSLEFEVQPGVFIPRPATETLVIEALQWLERRSTPRVLDLCTGTGCIAVSIAHSRADCQVSAVDLNPQAVEVANRNAARHGVSERVDVRHGDLYAALPENAKFDLIVSNPPYVRDDEIPELMPDVREHEPHLALSAGADGLDAVRRIVTGLPGRLADEGAIFLEISPEQAPAAIAIVESCGLFRSVDVVRDLDRAERVVRGRR